MYDDVAIANKIRFTENVIESIHGNVFVIFSHDLVPWIVVNGAIQKATWMAPLEYPAKRFAVETLIHTKAGFKMPPPLSFVVNPGFDNPGMITEEAKVGFIRTYLAWANALNSTDSDEIYGIGIVFSLLSPMIGIGDIYLREIKNGVDYRFNISYQFNESVPLVDALAEYVVKKDDGEDDV